MGYDDFVDGRVLTARIRNVTELDLSGLFPQVSDLTGLEDFTGLTYLNCSNMGLTTLDLNKNTALTHLNCSDNQLSGDYHYSLNSCNALTFLDCSNNQITSLDLTNNTALTQLWCGRNQLSCLNIKNSNNQNFTVFSATNNPNLNCIEVDDPAWSTANWTYIDAGTTFSTNCNYAGCI